MFKPKKSYLFVGLCLATALALSGCAGQKTADNETGDQNRSAGTERQNTNGGQMRIMNDNFAAASLSALAVGQKIMVMGAANADGSVMANQIIIGNADTDFSTSTFFRGLAGPGTASGTEGGLPDRQMPQGEDSRQRQREWQERTGGERPDFSRFENMTDGEREAMRERMMAEGGGMAGGGARQITRGANSGASRLSGEILDLDHSSLTLKLDAGGSKLVFYSQSTMINKINDNPQARTPGPDSPPPPAAEPPGEPVTNQ